MQKIALQVVGSFTQCLWGPWRVEVLVKQLAVCTDYWGVSKTNKCSLVQGAAS